MEKQKITPKEIFAQYKSAVDYKNGIGEKGLYEQAKINERFYVGDQWYGCKAGNDRPLARNNLIKRCGEYKMSNITAQPISVTYSAEGVNNLFDDDSRKEKDIVKFGMMQGEVPPEEPQEAEISIITEALSDYFRITAERIKFDGKKEQVLRNAYIAGTGVLYTYWDETIETGLYADESRNTAIKGDIAVEVLDIENVSFGDPNNNDVQSQPFIIIAQRLDVEAVRREARKNKRSDWEQIVPDGCENYNAGDRGEEEPAESRRVTVLTKFYKEYDKSESSYVIKAIKVTEKAVVRNSWELKGKLYPFSIFSWERRRSSIYGESEITYLIPNQIAINRLLSAAVWNQTMTGFSHLLVNGNVISDKVTNNPGQIIKVYGDMNDVAGAMRYVTPPQVSNAMQNFVDALATSTLVGAGATDASLGSLRIENASALIQMREAALQPLQIYMNRFYEFIEDTARIWADMWVNCYGDRKLRVEDTDGVNYIPFVAERYRNLLLVARVDVGSATMYSDSVSVDMLFRFYEMGVIDKAQLLDRIPKGIIYNVEGLKKDMQNSQVPGMMPGSEDEVMQRMAQNFPEQYAQYQNMSPEEQAQVNGVMGGTAV